MTDDPRPEKPTDPDDPDDGGDAVGPCGRHAIREYDPVRDECTACIAEMAEGDPGPDDVETWPEPPDDQEDTP